MIAGPAFPIGPAKAVATMQGFVARQRSCRMFYRGLPFPQGGMTARRDGRVSGSSVMGPSCSHNAEGLLCSDLAPQHRRVADPAAGDIDDPCFQRNCINPEETIAPGAWL